MQEKDSHGGLVNISRVWLQECDESRDSQKWGIDLITKQIYNKGRDGKDLCLTRSESSIKLEKCLEGNLRNSSQMWYFSRGWIGAWGVLLSFSSDNEHWTTEVEDGVGAGFRSIRPKYLADCERYKGKCYDVITGQLKSTVPFYGY